MIGGPSRLTERLDHRRAGQPVLRLRLSILRKGRCPRRAELHRAAVRPLCELYEDELASNFGPVALKPSEIK